MHKLVVNMKNLKQNIPVSITSPPKSPYLFNDTLTVSGQRRFGRKQQRFMHCTMPP